MPNNGALPILADTDVADALGAGADLSFEDGGDVPDTSGDEMFGNAVPVSAPKPALSAPKSTDDEWEDVSAKPALATPTPVTSAPATEERVPVPRRAPERKPEVPGRTQELKPNPKDIEEGRTPAEDEWEDVQPEKHPVRTAVREFAKGVVPSVSSIPAMTAGFGAGSVAGGALAGGAAAALGAAAGPIAWGAIGLGALLGGLTVGGAAGSMQAAGTRAVQDNLLEKTGIANKAAEDAENAENPEAAAAGEIASGFVGMSPRVGGGVLNQIRQRAMGAAAQGGISVGQQAATGDVDPQQAAIAGAAGAVAPGMTKGMHRWANIGEGRPPTPAAPPPAAEPEAPYTPNFTMQGEGVGEPMYPGSNIPGADINKNVGAYPGAANENEQLQVKEGPGAAQNDNAGQPIPRQDNVAGVFVPSNDNTRVPSNENPQPTSANDNYNLGAGAAAQDNMQGGPLERVPGTGFETEGNPAYGGPGGLEGEILPPWAPDPWSQDNRLGAPGNDDPRLAPPGQLSPGGGPSEGPYAGGSPIRQLPGRPDTKPGGNSTLPGLTQKSIDMIARSKGEAASSEPVKTGPGTSQVQPKPSEALGTIGTDTGFVFRDRSIPGNEDGRGYAKVNNAGTAARPATATSDDGTGFTPDVTNAIQGRLASVRPSYNANDNSTTPGKPGQRSPGMTQAARQEAYEQIPAGYGPDELNKPANQNVAGLGKPPEQQTLAPVSQEKLAQVPHTTKAAEAPAPAERRVLPDLTQQEPEHPVVRNRGAGYETVRRALETKGATKALEELERVPEVTPEHANAILEGIKARERQEQQAALKPRTKTGAEVKSKKERDQRDFAADTADRTLNKYLNTSGKLESGAELRNRLATAVKDYQETMKARNLPTALQSKGALSGGQRWLKKAVQVLQTKGVPDPERVQQWTTDEFLLSQPDTAHLVQDTDRIEGDVAMNRAKAKAQERQDAAVAEEARTGDHEPDFDEDALAKAEDKYEFDPETGRLTEKNPEHSGWSAIDPEDEDTPKFLREMTPEEIQDMQDKRTVVQNLAGLDHEAWEENGGGQRQRFNTQRPLADRLADHEPTKIGTADQRTRAKSLLNFVENEEGAFDPAKAHEDFIKAKDAIGELWQKRFGNALVPARQGKMGSRERQLAMGVEGAMSYEQAVQGMRFSHALTKLDGLYRTFAYPDKNWDGKGSRTAHIADRNWNFLVNFENGTKQKNAELQAADDLFRKVLKDAFDIEALEGSKAYWRDNYMAHMFENDDEAKRFDSWMTGKYGPKWFMKERMFDTLAEARENGFKLRFDNPAELVTQRLMAGISMGTKMRTLREMERIGAADQIDNARPGSLKSDGATEVTAPNGEKYLIQPEGQAMWKNAIDREGDLWLNKGNIGNVFRGWMHLKAIWVPMKLALSGFHLGHVAFIHSINGAAQGFRYGGVAGAARGLARNTAQVPSYVLPALSRTTLEPMARAADAFLKANRGSSLLDGTVKNLEAFGRMAKGFEIMDKFHDPNAVGDPDVQLILEAGMQGQSHYAANMKAAQALARGFGVRNPIGITGGLMNAANKLPPQNFMFHLIQGWKLAQLHNAASDMLHKHPEYVNDELLRRAAMRSLGKDLDDRYGEAFSNSKLWNKVWEGVGRGSFLSLDWQASQVRQFGGAGTDVLRNVGSAIGALPARGEVEQAAYNATSKKEFAPTYIAAAMAMGGLMTYALSGEIPDSPMDYIFPRVGGTEADGTPRRISMPHWTREFAMLGKHYGENGTGTMAAVGAANELLWSKMIFAPFVHLATNHDFFNRQMSDPNAPFFTQMGERLMSAATELGNPISYDSNKQIDNAGGSTGEKALSYMGFPPAPKYIQNTDMHNRIQKRFFAAHNDEKLYVNKERDADKTKMLHDYDKARTSGNTAEAYRLKKEIVAKGYLEAQNVGRHPAGSGDQYMFERLPRSDQIAMVKDMSQGEYERYVMKNSFLKRGDKAWRELAKARAEMMR